MASSKFLAKSPMCLLRMCLLSRRKFVPFLKRLSCAINCTFGSFEQLVISC